MRRTEETNRMTVLDTPILPAAPASSLSALEIDYLSAVLAALPDDQKFALDVGAHKGDVTEALADLGFRVLAVEPQDYMADRFAKRHAKRISDGTVRLARCAASDRHGEADLIIGSASTLSTLEPLWTSRGFPEEFRTPRSIRVPLLPLADLLREQDFGPVAFAKIDVEGHELAALRGLFGPNVSLPPMVMFEACQRFGVEAAECLALLASHGYRTFDIFIRIGPDPSPASVLRRRVFPPSGMRASDFSMRTSSRTTNRSCHRSSFPIRCNLCAISPMRQLPQPRKRLNPIGSPTIFPGFASFLRPTAAASR